ncbi:hypothetical protein EJB05_05763, partial [Eragrostis curvula]
MVLPPPVTGDDGECSTIFGGDTGALLPWPRSTKAGDCGRAFPARWRRRASAVVVGGQEETPTVVAHDREAYCVVVERKAPGLWMAARGGRRLCREPQPSPPQGGAPSPPGRSAASPDVNCVFVLAAPSALSAAHHVKKSSRADVFPGSDANRAHLLLPFDLPRGSNRGW